MGTSSLSWAHLPLHGLLLHGHIFPFMGTSSPHLPLPQTWAQVHSVGLALRIAYAELTRGLRKFPTMVFPCFSCNPDAVHEQNPWKFRRRLATLPGKTLQKQYLDLSKMLAHRFFWFLHFPSSKQDSKQDTNHVELLFPIHRLRTRLRSTTCPVLLTQPYATQGFAYANPPYDKLNTKHDVGGFSCGSSDSKDRTSAMRKPCICSVVRGRCLTRT